MISWQDSLKDGYPGMFYQKTVQSTGISAAVYNPHLYGFSEPDRREGMTQKQALQGISAEPRNWEYGLKTMIRFCTFT